ncbi:hypothetical protein BT93_L2957 [Corymbia citriodora subsp. variegata]|uniref:SAC domain-containing protein n=1 Tax=Corymbia citriodora subsp. variegata TaxID=360336 RepID=A0A8T0CNN8_CORYI|nr:hypothetical protein BT93_L2957 [Corymbia citriodora subsp. variegata]
MGTSHQGGCLRSELDQHFLLSSVFYFKVEGSLISSYFGSLNFLNNGDDADSFETDSSSSCSKLKLPMFQRGVLRTNCTDCLDCTNVAQYAYGLVALGRQLHSIGCMESENIELDDPLAEELMRIYETMGDMLALQYGGSAAHNKVSFILFSMLLCPPDTRKE